MLLLIVLANRWLCSYLLRVCYDHKIKYTCHILVTVLRVAEEICSSKYCGRLFSSFFLSIPIRLVQSYLSVAYPFSSDFSHMLNVIPHFFIALNILFWCIPFSRVLSSSSCFLSLWIVLLIMLVSSLSITQAMKFQN